MFLWVLENESMLIETGQYVVPYSLLSMWYRTVWSVCGTVQSGQYVVP
jgi:hypothetical protein